MITTARMRASPLLRDSLFNCLDEMTSHSLTDIIELIQGARPLCLISVDLRELSQHGIASGCQVVNERGLVLTLPLILWQQTVCRCQRFRTVT
jgi:hypothetical protein